MATTPTSPIFVDVIQEIVEKSPVNGIAVSEFTKRSGHDRFSLSQVARLCTHVLNDSGKHVAVLLPGGSKPSIYPLDSRLTSMKFPTDLFDSFSSNQSLCDLQTPSEHHLFACGEDIEKQLGILRSEEADQCSLELSLQLASALPIELLWALLAHLVYRSTPIYVTCAPSASGFFWLSDRLHLVYTHSLVNGYWEGSILSTPPGDNRMHPRRSFGAMRGFAYRIMSEAEHQ